MSQESDETKARWAEACKRFPKSYASRQKERIFRTRRQGWLVEKIWPEGTIHIIAGPSGVGKTTWMLPAIKDWSEGKPVLGYTSYPMPYVYIMCDRSETDLQRTLDRLGLSDWDIPAYSIESLGHDSRYMAEPSTLTIESLPEIFPWAKVFFIEAYNYFYKNAAKNAVGDYQNTLRFWSAVRDSFSQKDLTIVATTHEAKGNEYSKTRDKVYGNVGQVAVAGTIIAMEFHEKDPDLRLVRVAPRDSKESCFEYRFNDKGLLEFITEGSPEERDDKAAFKLMDNKLKRVYIGDHIPTSTIIAWGADAGLSLSTVEKWLKARVDQGKLIRVSRGLYCLPNEQ